MKNRLNLFAYHTILALAITAVGAEAQAAAAVSAPVVITRGEALEVNVPSLPADVAQAPAIDKNIPVSLADVQLQEAFAAAAKPEAEEPTEPAGPKVIRLESAPTQGLAPLSKLRSKPKSNAQQKSPAAAKPAPQATLEPAAQTIAPESPPVQFKTADAYIAPAPLAEAAPMHSVHIETLSPKIGAEIAPVAVAVPMQAYIPPMPTSASLPTELLAGLPLPSLPSPIVFTEASLAPAALPEISPVQSLHIPVPVTQTIAVKPLAYVPPTPSSLSTGIPTDLLAGLSQPSLPSPIIFAEAPVAPSPASLPAPATIAALAPAAGGALPALAPHSTVTAPTAAAALDTALAVPTLEVKAPSALSKESRAVLSRTPSNIDTPKPEKLNKPIAIDRVRDSSPMLGDSVTELKSSHEAMGIKMEVRRPGIDIQYELEMAYAALASGQHSMAIEIYSRALQASPNSLEAQVGLATAYQRAGQLQKARTLYAEVLKKDPDNREALNNFLGLAAEEAPDEALARLAALAKRNPNFAAIPAQMATIYLKKGDLPAAVDALNRALVLAPESLPYTYNLAVALDKMGRRAEAASLYSQLVNAHIQGETLPADIRAVQERLTFLRSNSGVN